MKETTETIFGIVFGIYAFIGVCAFGVFSWQFAQQHGFWAYLIFGEIVPFLKAIVWPLFINF